MKSEKTRDFYKEFGEFIRNGRNERGLTQKETAERLGMTQAHYSRLENGLRTADLDTVWNICDVLQLDLTEFKRISA